MKVLILNYEFPPLGGGAGNATHYLLKQFAQRPDLEIDLVTSSADTFRQEKFADNINIFYLDIGKKNDLLYQTNGDLIKYSWKSYRHSKKLAKTKEYDLVHAFFGLPCGLIANRLKIPSLISLRGSDVPFYNPRFKALDKLVFARLSRFLWKNSQATIANSQGLKDLALENSPQQDIQIICNGVDINEFIPTTKPNKDFVVLSTSRLIKRKGLEYLISGFAKFCQGRSNCKLVLAGSGDLAKELSDQVSQLGINSQVEFTGPIDHTRIPRLYQQADVFVLPSLNEGMSNCLLEAMAAGLAIIATDTGGSQELIGADNGIIIKKKSSRDIAKALTSLYQDNRLLQSKKTASRQRAKTMDWSTIADQYLKLYYQTTN